MARKKKQPEHVNHERWLVSYADFITLLFAFFVVMYAISELDKRKLVQAQESFQFALDTPDKGGDSRDPFAVFDARAALPFGILDPVPEAETIKSEDGGNSREAQPEEGALATEKPEGDLSKRELAQLNRLREDVESSIFIDGMDGTKLGIDVDVTQEGLRIRIPGDALFRGAATELTPQAWTLLGDLAATLRPDTRKLRIDGHEAETHDADRPGRDWELSLLRASRIARLLVSRGGVQPERINAAGYGHHRPVIASSLGEAANRRYDIIVLARN